MNPADDAISRDWEHRLAAERDWEVRQRARSQAPELYDALLALYHAIPPHVLDGAPELEQALSVLRKVSGKSKP